MGARHMVLMLAIGAAAVACKNEVDDPVDAGIHDGGTVPADAEVVEFDAATLVCDGPGACECFSNYDCPATHACTSLDETGENVWCLEGPRGTGEAGDPCEDETDCESALCVEGDGGQFYCSDLCETADTCPDELPECLYIGFGIDESICAPS